MGVQGLWTLLMPSGKKLDIKALEGQRLAIDISIWLLRIIYGYIAKGKDQKFMHNIHLICVLRRILVLLQYQIKPVFVFDGKAPELKRKTLILRKELREKKVINLKKLAENYIVKRLEQHAIFNQSELSQDEFENEKEKAEEEEIMQIINDLKGEEKSEFEKNLSEYQNLILDAEFEIITKNYPQFLQICNISQEEYLLSDIPKKLNIVQILYNHIQQNQQQEFINIENIEEFSKRQSEQYIQYINNKAQVDKIRQQVHEKIKNQQENEILESSKQMNFLDKLFNDPNRKVLSGQFKSERDKAYYFIKENLQENKLNNKDQEQKLNNQQQYNFFDLFQKQRITKKQQINNISNKMNIILHGRESENKRQQLIEEELNKKNDYNFAFENQNLQQKQQVNQEQIILKNKIQEKNKFITQIDDLFDDFSDYSEGQNEQQQIVENDLEIEFEKREQDQVQDSFPDQQNTNQQQISQDNQDNILLKQYEHSLKKQDNIFYDDQNQIGFQNQTYIFQNSNDAFNIQNKYKNENQQQQQQNNYEKDQQNQIQFKQQENEQVCQQFIDEQIIQQDKQNNQNLQEFSTVIQLKNQNENSENNNDRVLQGQQHLQQQNIEIKQRSQEIEIQNYLFENQDYFQQQKISEKQIIELQSFLQNKQNQLNIKIEEQDEEKEIELLLQEINQQQSQIPEEQNDQQQNQNQNNYFQEMGSYELQEEYNKFINLNELNYESIQSKLEQIKQLLMIFGIPWVEAPGEAEAQAAFLEQSGLVDGIITEDSDVFLFGGKKVYRNFYDNKSFIHYYDYDNIVSKLGIDREKLIYLSLFLGSDYTLGIKGVGIVNAVEIIESFQNMEALKRFNVWANKADILLENVEQYYQNITESEKIFKQKHKNYKKQWEIPHDFPSQKVVKAYMEPFVDESQEQFRWGAPNFEILKNYCLSLLEWSVQYTETILKPFEETLKQQKMPRQLKITDYFQKADRFAIINSKRIQMAIKGLKKNNDESQKQQLKIEENSSDIENQIIDQKSQQIFIKKSLNNDNDNNNDDEQQQQLSISNKKTIKNQKQNISLKFEQEEDEEQQFENIDNFRYQSSKNKKKQ